MYNVKPIGHHCCQKVLPLVYDESLSYYEVLCKLTNKINELVDVIDNNLDNLIREQLDKLFIDAMYDAENETLILILGMENK